MSEQPPTRLAHDLGLGDAIVIGLGSMIGAGVFAAVGPAADVAGAGLLLGLGIAAAVAYCNATSSAALAARYPTSGGTYVYGRERLGEFWGYLAGWGFVVGKTASSAAMALTVGAYASPSGSARSARQPWWVSPPSTSRGVRKTAVSHAGDRRDRACLARGRRRRIPRRRTGHEPEPRGPRCRAAFAGVLQSAGLLFFAFAGYARIATLGEEVRDPERTIPKAIPRALGDHPRRLRRRRRSPRSLPSDRRRSHARRHRSRLPSRPAPSTG